MQASTVISIQDVAHQVLPASAVNTRGHWVNFDTREPLFYEGDEAEKVYQLLSGAVMLSQTLRDGRRQVVDLIQPGEYFGLGDGTVQDCSAETLMPSRIMVWNAQAASRDPELQRAIAESLRLKVSRLHDHMTLLGRKTSVERVASLLMRFVPECGGRICRGLPPAGYDQRAHEICMSRQEIGDYLGMTLETVSRTLSHLKQQKLIACPKPTTIVIKDLCGLCRLAALH